MFLEIAHSPKELRESFGETIVIKGDGALPLISAVYSTLPVAPLELYSPEHESWVGSGYHGKSGLATEVKQLIGCMRV